MSDQQPDDERILLRHESLVIERSGRVLHFQQSTCGEDAFICLDASQVRAVAAVLLRFAEETGQ